MRSRSWKGVVRIATIQDVMDWMEELAPAAFAESWDRVGLQWGRPEAVVRGVLTALTVTSDVIDQAAAAGASLIVAHHPLIFQPLDRIDPRTRVGSLVVRLIREELALFVAHTNWDAARGGVNDGLAERLQLVDPVPLADSGGERRWKLVTFVPPEHVDSVRDALARAGAGKIGNYSHCTFGVLGEGTFLPESGASPHIGEVGRLERVREIRLEAVVTESTKRRAVRSLIASHPYEEVAFDLYPLDRSTNDAGIGRVGALPKPMTTQEFAVFVQNSLSFDSFRLAGADPGRIERVAVVGGSGGGFVHEARAAGADALVTGDVDYHDADEARSLGLLVVDGGHFGTERHAPGDLARRLRDRARAAGDTLDVRAARESDVFWLPDAWTIKRG